MFLLLTDIYDGHVFAMAPVFSPSLGAWIGWLSHESLCSNVTLSVLDVNDAMIEFDINFIWPVFV